MSDLNAATLAELHAVKGTLAAILQTVNAQHVSTREMLTQQHESTNRRIDDLRTSMTQRNEAIEKRIDGTNSRVGTLEQNERATAIKAATVGAFSGAVTGALVHLLRLKG